MDKDKKRRLFKVNSRRFKINILENYYIGEKFKDI